MRYTTTDGPDEPLNAIQEGSLGNKMGIADVTTLLYLKEAMQAFRAGCMLSSTVMLGGIC